MYKEYLEIHLQKLTSKYPTLYLKTFQDGIVAKIKNCH